MMKLRKISPTIDMSKVIEKDLEHLSLRGMVTLGIFALVVAKLSTIIVSGLIDLFFNLFM